MPTTSRYYNDPSLGQGFSNLASMFEPPSGTDLAGYATANAKKAEAARLAELFDYTKRPDFNREQFDRMGVVADLFDPTNSYYSVDQGNAVTMRGQDITSRTSLQNNTADNAAAMERQRLVQDTLMRNNDANRNNAITLKTMDPLAKNETRQYPPAIADLYDVPAVQRGIVSADQGEVNVLPGGEIIRGDPKPLSETEWKARKNDELVKEGLLTNQMIADIANGTQTPVTVMKDGTPTYMTPGAATRLNMPAFVNQGAQAKPTNYKTPDGRLGTATVNEKGVMVDTQTQEALPPGTVTFGTNVQGNATDTGISTPANNTDATKREAEIKFSKQRLKDYRELLQANPGIIGVPGQIRGFFQDTQATVKELAAAYGDGPIGSIEEAQKLMDQIGIQKGYDPNIRRAQALALEMAYADAKSSDPSGEVNVKEMERFLSKYNGGLGGNQAVLASLDELERSLDTRLATQVKTLRNPGDPLADQPVVAADPLEGQTATNPQTQEKLIRRNGKWEPAQ